MSEMDPKVAEQTMGMLRAEVHEEEVRRRARIPTQPTELRDYFAAHALQAMIGADTKGKGGGWDWDRLAQEAYHAAEAMLRRRPG